MGVLRCRPLAFGQIARRIGHVDLDPFNQRAKGVDELALAASFHLGLLFRVDLGVPGIVELAGFHDGRGCGQRVAAALDGHLCEGGLGRVTVVRVGFQRDHVIDLEVGDDERTSADRLGVLFGAGRGRGTYAGAELGLLQDRCGCAGEGLIGIGLGCLKHDLDGQRIGGFNRFYAFIFGALRAATLGVGAVFPGKLDVFRGQRCAVRPGDAFLQLPGDRGQVSRDAAIFYCRDLDGQTRHHIAVLIERGERIQHQRSGLDILGARGQIGVHCRNRLIIQDLQLAIRAAFGLGGRGQHKGCSSAHQQGLDFHIRGSPCW